MTATDVRAGVTDDPQLHGNFGEAGGAVVMPGNDGAADGSLRW
jgi:hypothetical protein